MPLPLRTPSAAAALPSASMTMSFSSPMAGPSHTAQDELTQTVFGAVEGLTQVRKARFLLETSLALIESGRYVHSHSLSPSSPPPAPSRPDARRGLCGWRSPPEARRVC